MMPAKEKRWWHTSDGTPKKNEAPSAWVSEKWLRKMFVFQNTAVCLKKKNEARNSRHSIDNTEYREMKKLDVEVPA